MVLPTERFKLPFLLDTGQLITLVQVVNGLSRRLLWYYDCRQAAAAGRTRAAGQNRPPDSSRWDSVTTAVTAERRSVLPAPC